MRLCCPAGRDQDRPQPLYGRLHHFPGQMHGYNPEDLEVGAQIAVDFILAARGGTGEEILAVAFGDAGHGGDGGDAERLNDGGDGERITESAGEVKIDFLEGEEVGRGAVQEAD